MNPYDYYITPEDYAQAAAIGVKSYTLDRRIRSLGWSKEKALTTPNRARKDRSRWSKIASQNGIKRNVFYDRVRKGWSEERAATEPLSSPDRQRDLALQASKIAQRYSDEIIALRKQNGIGIQTFHYRVNVCGWAPEKAATEPKMDRQQVGRLGAQRAREKYGDLYNITFRK